MSDVSELQATLGAAYTIERELGGGGMSRVYVARENALGRSVVIKTLPPEMAGQVSMDRFRREIATAAQLQHPHIVPVLSAGESNGLPYFTMPFIRGETLRARLANTGALSVSEAIRVLREVASALRLAHQHGIVHRDIKPENILISGDAAMVTDFGVAKAVDAASGTDGVKGMTTAGVVLGTPAYMSPEQAVAEPDIDHRSDIYSLGVVGYEMLAGAPPFGERTAQRMLAAHVHETPPALGALRPELPPGLAALVMRCLEKRPGDRPQSADEILAALDHLATPGAGSVPLAKRPTRRLAATLSLLAVAVIAWLVIGRMRARAAEPRSIAVLPFATVGATAANAYFAEGMTAEITSALTNIAGLNVSARTLASAAAANEPDPRAVGRRLGVKSVLQGSVQQSGDRVRLIVQLINVSDGFNVWGNTYDATLKDVFPVQDSIARSIVSALRVRLATPSAPIVRTATEDPVAHNLVLQATYLWNRRSAQSLQEAMRLANEAVRRDPEYAKGYATLALCYTVLPDYLDVDARMANDSAVYFAKRALAIDSGLADAYAALGTAHMRMFRNGEATRAMEKAIAIDSSFATARHWHAFLLDHLGRHDEAVEEIRTAAALDPASMVIRVNVALMLYHARRYAEAESTAAQAVAFDPTFVTGHMRLGQTLLLQGRSGPAITAMLRGMEGNTHGLAWNVAQLAHAYAVSGNEREARRLLAELRARPAAHSTNLGLSLIYTGLGDIDAAVASLDRAVAAYDANLWAWSRDPRFDRLRADPRGAALFAKVEQP